MDGVGRDDDRRIWDAEAAGFDAAPDHGLRDPVVREAWRSLLAAELPPAPARIADLGCGTGTLVRLLAEEGHRVDGLDVAPEMIRRAEAKIAGIQGATVRLGDANDPDLDPGSFDVVLSRHVLWAMRDPADALRRWLRLVRPGGRVVLVEGRWSTGVGLARADTVDLVRGAGLAPESRLLDDPALWGGPIGDERYLVVADLPPAPLAEVD